QPQPEYARIEASIALMGRQADLAWDAMTAAYEAGSDEAKQKIDQLEGALGEGDSQLSLTAVLETAEGIPDDFREAVRIYEAQIAKIDAAKAELEKHTLEKAADIRQQALQLEASLDYDKVVAVAFENDINVLHGVSRVIGMRQLLEVEPLPTYDQLESIKLSLLGFTERWQEEGLIREGGVEPQEPEGVALDPEKVAAIEARVLDAEDIHAKYRKHDEAIQANVREVQRLTRQIKESGRTALTVDELFKSTPTIHNQELGAAVNRRLMQKLGELPADFEADLDSEAYARLVEEARSIEATEVLKNLEISGTFENLPFTFSEAELKQFLLNSVPSNALASIKRVQFRPLTKEEDEADNTWGLHSWSKELNGWEIIISDAKLGKYYQDALEEFNGTEAKAMALLSTKNSMLQTVSHEFGHALHQVLPLAALQRWEQQRASDPVNITAYVKGHHDTDHVHRYREDFSDTYALFVNRPEVLIAISPTRFAAMRQILEEYMPDYAITLQQQQDRLIANSDLSDADVRRIYLRHEAT
ncbi:MAG TPA: hypothetical protein VMR98_05565, partial [Candidatus Polarisedimenticolaceae bacterium]|nr:hypothetical protein [Candidatus Polarisedimenticolaceae bacterium]